MTVRINKFTHDSGAAYILGLALILTILLFAALIIDLLRAERTCLTLQVAADAAALAGAFQLQNSGKDIPIPPISPIPWDGDAGWRRSKEAVFELLGKNAVFGNGGEVSAGVATSCSGPGGSAVSYDAVPMYQCIIYEYPNLTVTIERGLYYQVGEERLFLSLETVRNCADLLPGCNPNNLGELGNDVPEVANAVQVTLHLKTLNTVFARSAPFSVSNFLDLNRHAMAAWYP